MFNVHIANMYELRKGSNDSLPSLNLYSQVYGIPING